MSSDSAPTGPGDTIGPEPPGIDDLDDADEQPRRVELPPPRMKGKKLRDLWRTRKWLKKRRKLKGEGYVMWYLVDDTVSRPMFVQPERKGGGIPEYEHDDETYLFPRSAMVPSEGGMWTIMHRKGEAQPINIDDPGSPSVSSDALKEYLTMRVSASSPGLLDGLGLDSGDLLKIMVALIIGIALFNQFSGGSLL